MLKPFCILCSGAPPRHSRVLQPTSVSDTNILQHLPGTRKSIPHTLRAKANRGLDLSLRVWKIEYIRFEAYSKSETQLLKREKARSLNVSYTSSTSKGW
ncbi:hypothetical protein L211DRAFT_133345 [Terfezia boudieri ATCC MYA-4762]|uniref:Uncharacterized protein n=1 Tax=Terfezia boudieri ATCC MYA-4762 TaxID=1051890 RepID=A0A3N4LWG9_9PEZI|nr:hypothetical protein L211DRAFT_133345 [Terfezia boudieri ATCC MYA-4762]